MNYPFKKILIGLSLLLSLSACSGFLPQPIKKRSSSSSEIEGSSLNDSNNISSNIIASSRDYETSSNADVSSIYFNSSSQTSSIPSSSSSTNNSSYSQNSSITPYSSSSSQSSQEEEKYHIVYYAYEDDTSLYVGQTKTIVFHLVDQQGSYVKLSYYYCKVSSGNKTLQTNYYYVDDKYGIAVDYSCNTVGEYKMTATLYDDNKEGGSEILNISVKEGGYHAEVDRLSLDLLVSDRCCLNFRIVNYLGESLKMSTFTVNSLDRNYVTVPDYYYNEYEIGVVFEGVQTGTGFFTVVLFDENYNEYPIVIDYSVKPFYWIDVQVENDRRYLSTSEDTTLTVTLKGRLGQNVEIDPNACGLTNINDANYQIVELTNERFVISLRSTNYYADSNIEITLTSSDGYSYIGNVYFYSVNEYFNVYHLYVDCSYMQINQETSINIYVCNPNNDFKNIKSVRISSTYGRIPNLTIDNVNETMYHYDFTPISAGADVISMTVVTDDGSNYYQRFTFDVNE